MTENPLAQPYRPIRRVMPPDAPLPGILAASAGQTVLLVESDAVPGALWRPDEPVHVWVPVDVARRGNAQAAVFPWCATTLEAYLRRRVDTPIEGGEAVTLLVSLLRGFREAAVDDAATGRWWLTDEGCPTFVPGEGARLKLATVDAAEEIAAALDERTISRLVAELPRLLGPPADAAGIDRAERDLFEAFAPKPLRTLAARSATAGTLPDVERGLAARPQARRRTDAERLGSRSAPERESILGRLRAAAASLLSRPSDARTAAGTAAAQGSGRRRRGVLLAAGGAAVAVMALGLTWPDGTRERAAGAQSASTSTASQTAALPSTTPGAPPSNDRGSEDPLVAGRWLITAAASCGDCTDIALSPDAARAAAGLTDPTLLEDYGGIAVIRATTGDGERFLVLEQRDEQWWIRGVTERER